MLKLVVSVILGIAITLALVAAADTLWHALGSTGSAPSQNDRQAMAGWVAGQPVAGLASLVVGWALAGFVGSWVAARFAGRGAWPGWLVTGFLLAATAFNFYLIPHPLWLIGAAPLLIVLAGWLASRLGAMASPASALA